MEDTDGSPMPASQFESRAQMYYNVTVGHRPKASSPSSSTRGALSQSARENLGDGLPVNEIM